MIQKKIAKTSTLLTQCDAIYRNICGGQIEETVSLFNLSLSYSVVPMP